MTINTRKHWLDNDGRFKFGRFKGEYAEDVAKEDISYIEWVLTETENLHEEDEKVLEALYERYGG